MSLLQTEQLSKSFGTQRLFAPFSAQVSRGDRIALIGDNGIGKSTLLSILAGIEAPSEGAITSIGEVRVGHLPQTARLHHQGTLWEAMECSFDHLRGIESELRRLEAQAAEGNEQALHRYDDLLHRFAHDGGYEIEARIRAALIGVGFGEEEFATPTNVLSGGEEARAALARVLLEAPDLLLLDEPTNHLDFAALDWLEERLLGFDGALVLVSHDRHLLERVGNRTWEIGFGEVTAYSVGYAQSRELRELERERRLELFERQEETIDKYKDFIRRNKVGQKHRQAKDREKKLERIEQDRIEAPKDARRISLHIPIAEPSGKRVLSLRGTTIGYDSPLFECPDLDLYRGEKVAIVGPNGCGKTTLLKAITGERAPRSGVCETGHGVRPATYSQTQEGLHGPGTVLDAILSRSKLTIGEARGLLGRFLFSGDDVLKKTSALSGGERSRVALALLSLMKGNLLLLDEPTNHLDLASQEILEQALAEYEGTILLVSHDRALLEAITTQIWEVRNGHLEAHTYGYREYRKRITEQRGRTGKPPVNDAAPEAAKRPAAGSKAKKKDKFQAQREAEAIRTAEEAIEGLEIRLAEVEQALVEASASGDADRITDLGIEHKQIQADLAARYEEWESATTVAE